MVEPSVHCTSLQPHLAKRAHQLTELLPHSIVLVQHWAKLEPSVPYSTVHAVIPIALQIVPALALRGNQLCRNRCLAREIPALLVVTPKYPQATRMATPALCSSIQLQIMLWC